MKFLKQFFRWVFRRGKPEPKMSFKSEFVMGSMPLNPRPIVPILHKRRP